MKRTYFKCILECPAKYKIDYCENLDCGNIYSHDEHNHALEEYANSNGLAEEIKTAIRIILEHNSTLFPKKVRLQLIMDKAKYKIEHLKKPHLLINILFISSYEFNFARSRTS